MTGVSCFTGSFGSTSIGITILEGGAGGIDNATSNKDACGSALLTSGNLVKSKSSKLNKFNSAILSDNDSLSIPSNKLTTSCAGF